MQRAKPWAQKPYDRKTRDEAAELIEKGGDELIDAFYTDLDFGTGGLRGKMGVGTNRINRYTLGTATQGLANYLKGQFPGQNHRVAIAHDSRHNSNFYAHRVAQVLSANGIKVFVFNGLRPTPELSFAIRHLDCHAGIVITASHNPPEYNGYKVYWRDGGQLVPPHDKGVIHEVRKVKPEDVKTEDVNHLITTIGREVDLAYLEEITKLSFSDAGKKDLQIVFTPIHGTSIMAMPQALEACGFKKVHIVKEQARPDGDFPTVQSPNPEEAEALSMAVEQANKIGADLVIGTDPDADRVGIAVRDLKNRMVLLNGNQTAAVLVYYVLEQWHQKGLLTGKEFIAKTIVTSDLLDRIAEHYKVDCPNVLTGFKWIARYIREHRDKKFIVGGEESYGYMIGNFVRDKDAIASGVMIAEAAAWAKSRGSSFYQTLIEIYHKFGFYLEDLVSMKKDGHKGAEEIKQMMEDFRTKTPAEVGGEKIVALKDYKSLVHRDLRTGEEKPLDFPKSNVVQFFTDKGTKITARPSGTEPKIKFYISVNEKLEFQQDFAEIKNHLENRIEAIKKSLGL